ncbi:nuclease-related domain-containing protein [Paenibacillus sp. UMB7766-LJ446]|uniref:nuclease-related domain-containing protein n=1 Tax=Paenibacillus sp. UMB7766-LJ446 TaxID=3046313 RepID=UPI00254F40AF|nr:nuclease-related domain-containing protein [Paenibacillus sp. UMB7766-LJ446]MDK8193102.1 nuclease-related domain-containing protein [Paenibacillus sp. UMB7766-LJ446]
MFNTIKSWFKIQNNETTKKMSTSKNISSNRTTANKSRIDPSRIGDLGEHKINIQLDQLPKDTKYINDIMIINPKSRTGYSQIDHVVISPFGLFVIETKNYNGEIKGSRKDKYWRVNNRFNMYNPLKQNYGHIKALEHVLVGYPDLLFVSIVSFTMRCRFSIDPELRKIESNELIVYDTELSEFIYRKIIRVKTITENAILNNVEVQQIYESLLSANITDVSKRAEHINKMKKNS